MGVGVLSKPGISIGVSVLAATARQCVLSKACPQPTHLSGSPPQWQRLECLKLVNGFPVRDSGKEIVMLCLERNVYIQHYMTLPRSNTNLIARPHNSGQ